MIVHLFYAVLGCAIFFTIISLYLETPLGRAIFSGISMIFWFGLAVSSLELTVPMYNGTAIQSVDGSSGWAGVLFSAVAIIMFLNMFENIIGSVRKI